MVENRAIQCNGADVTIGDTTRPVSEIVSIMAREGTVRVEFSDGVSAVADDIKDLFTLRDRCPWAAVVL